MSLTQAQVSKLYVTVFGRASEGAGNAYWRASARSLVEGADKMLETQAAKDYFGSSMDDDRSFIEYIYKNSLGKTYTDDPTGIEYWTNSLGKGLSRGAVVASLVDAVDQYENSNDPVTKAAYDRFTNRVKLSNMVSNRFGGENLDPSDAQIMGMYSGLASCVNHLPESKSASAAIMSLIPRNGAEQTAEVAHLVNSMLGSVKSIPSAPNGSNTLKNVSNYLDKVAEEVAKPDCVMNSAAVLSAVDEVVKSAVKQPALLDDPLTAAQTTLTELAPIATPDQGQGVWSLLLPTAKSPYLMYASDGTKAGSGNIEALGGDTPVRMFVSKSQDEAVVQYGNKVYSVQDVTNEPLLVSDNISYGYNNFVTVGDVTLIPDGNIAEYAALITDGSRAGTSVVANMDDYSANPKYNHIINSDAGVIWSKKYTEPFGDELFLTTVSTAGVHSTIVKDINPGADSSIRLLKSQDHSILLSNGNLLFRGTDGKHGNEPWITDGTAAGTFMLADLKSGRVSSDPAGFATFGDLAAFKADTTDYGTELVVTDGTIAGTSVVDLNKSVSSLPVILGHTGGNLYVRATIDKVKTIVSIDSTLEQVHTKVDVNADPVAWGESIAYFTHTDSEHGTELWALNPAQDQFYMVKDILAGTGGSLPEDAVLVDDHLLFSAYTSATSRGWIISDGTDVGTVELAATAPIAMHQFDDMLLYANSAGVYSLDLAQSTFEPQLLNGSFGGQLNNFQADSDQLYFVDAQQKLHTTYAATGQIEELLGNVASFKVVAENALYAICEQNNMASLWFSDATADGTYFVAEMDNPASAYNMDAAIGIKTEQFLDVGA